MPGLIKTGKPGLTWLTGSYARGVCKRQYSETLPSWLTSVSKATFVVFKYEGFQNLLDLCSVEFCNCSDLNNGGLVLTRAASRHKLKIARTVP